jgi:hypothetical protein
MISEQFKKSLIINTYKRQLYLNNTDKEKVINSGYLKDIMLINEDYLQFYKNYQYSKIKYIDIDNKYKRTIIDFIISFVIKINKYQELRITTQKTT